MSRAFITVGDMTSHGGRVITGDLTWDINGKPVARVGDLTVCPRCKGVFRITTGAEDTLTMGQAPARHADLTECGAFLIASQMPATWSSKSDLAGAVQSGVSETLTATTARIAQEAPSICLECLQKAGANGAATVIRE